MLTEYEQTMLKLRDAGWHVEALKTQMEIPSIIRDGYAWAPAEIVQFIGGLGKTSNPGDTAWILGAPDFAGKSDSAFRWNEWERISREAAEGNDLELSKIEKFWDEHMPLLLSVKSGYAYFALDHDLSIVQGEEPEFENTTVIAPSLLDLLSKLSDPGPLLQRWV